MPNEIQLGQIVEEVRAELGMALDPNLGIDLERTIKLKAKRIQHELWFDVDWAHLQVYRYKAMRAGERYYAFPDDLDADRIYKAEYKFNNIYLPLSFGIDRQSFVFRDSERNQRQDPILQWDFHREQTNDNLQFEVWPTPASNGSLYLPITDPPSEETFDPDRNTDGDRFIRFEGIKNLNPFTENDHYSTLDGDLIVLLTAASFAPKYAKEDAETLNARATKYFRKLTGRMKKTDPFLMGTDIDQRSRPRRQTLNSFRLKYVRQNP